MAEYNDPFSQFYHDIWTEVKKDAKLSELIPTANMVELVSNKAELFFNPIEPMSRQTDQPVLVLMPEQSAANTVEDNAGMLFVFEYSWNVYTPYFTVSTSLYPITWNLFRAVAAAKNAAYSFKWKSNRYVSDVSLGFGEFNNPQYISNGSGGLNIFAWKTSIAMSVRFSFKKGAT